MSSTIFVFGNGDCDQLGLEFDEDAECRDAKVPKKPELFDMSMGVFDKVAIVKIAVGGQHSAAIDISGRCYTWGNNDNGPLGRQGCEDKPLVVADLPNRITDVSCGDCHTIFYSTERNEAYFCGLYRIDAEGIVKGTTATTVPTRIGAQTWQSDLARPQTLKKICSGANHTVALTHQGKVYAWGSYDNAKIGRVCKGRDRVEAALQIKPLNVKDAVDIFVGKNHSFYTNKKGHLYSWGCNFCGQLGIGTCDDTHLPTLVKELKGQKVAQVAGGADHSVALTIADDGTAGLYTWGLNVNGQLGVGDTFGDYTRAVKAEERQTQKNLNYIEFFKRPELINNEFPEGAITKSSKIFAGKHYSYYLEEESNKAYSWGMGEEFVLGSRVADDQFTPVLVSQKMFKLAKIEDTFELTKVRQIGCGNSHVVVLGSATEADQNDIPVLEKNEQQEQESVQAEQQQSQAAEIVQEEEKEPTVYLSCKSGEQPQPDSQERIIEASVEKKSMNEVMSQVEGGVRREFDEMTSPLAAQHQLPITIHQQSVEPIAHMGTPNHIAVDDNGHLNDVNDALLNGKRLHE